MRPLPLDPTALHGKLIEALCEDWLRAGKVTRDTPIADVILEIARQQREELAA